MAKSKFSKTHFVPYSLVIIVQVIPEPICRQGIGHGSMKDMQGISARKEMNTKWSM